MRFSLFLVAYDLSIDKERRKVEKLMTSLGQRVQKSVFECQLDKARETRLLVALRRLKLQSGDVRIYRLSSESVHRIIGVPALATTTEQSASFVV